MEHTNRVDVQRGLRQEAEKLSAYTVTIGVRPNPFKILLDK
jgi:hypothetical protein